MEREAYQWNAELSVYLDQNATSHGIDTQLVTKIIALLRLQGIKKLVSGITQPNPKSDGLHSKLSFKLVGTGGFFASGIQSLCIGKSGHGKKDADMSGATYTGSPSP